jgi:hypothetical protein
MGAGRGDVVRRWDQLTITGSRSWRACVGQSDLDLQILPCPGNSLDTMVTRVACLLI